MNKPNGFFEDYDMISGDSTQKLPPVVVFGAGGFIGNALSAYLKRGGREVISLTRTECDMLSPEQVSGAISRLPVPCPVVLCSCISRHKEDSFNSFTKNTQMIENFVRAASPGKVMQTIYLSSTDVYGDAPELPITEKTAIRPNGYYGLSKFACEQILFHHAARIGSVSALRLPGIYGPNDMGRSILGMFTRRIIAGQEVTVFGDGSTMRDFVLVEDLCKLIQVLLERPYHGVLNVAKGESLRLDEILKLISLHSGSKLNIVHAQPGKRSSDLVFNVPVLSRVAPSVVFTPLHEGIERLVEANK